MPVDPLRRTPRSWARYGLCTAIVTCVLVGSPAAAQSVILISVDGLRADAIDPELTPAIARLSEEGAYTLAAKSLRPTLTVPNHISMVTGLTPETHGVTEATAPPGFTVQGSIFELARQAGITTG